MVRINDLPPQPQSPFFIKGEFAEISDREQSQCVDRSARRVSVKLLDGRDAMCLQNFNAIESIRLSNSVFPIPGVVFQHLAQLSTLRDFDFEYFDVVHPFDTWRCITCSPFITRVVFDAYDVTDEILLGVGKMTQLSILYLLGNPVTDLGIDHLKDLVAMEAIELNACGFITSKSMLTISRWPNLRWLSLPGFADISAESIESLLQHVPKLEHFEIFGEGNLTDRTLTVLSECPRLRHVSFGYCPAITSDGVRQLLRLPSLEDIRLYRSGLPPTLADEFQERFPDAVVGIE